MDFLGNRWNWSQKDYFSTKNAALDPKQRLKSIIAIPACRFQARMNSDECQY